MSNIVRSTIIALSFIWLAPTASLAATEDAAKRIEQYYDVLRDAWQRSEELGFVGRFDLLEPAVESTFDMPYIAEFTVGRYWKDLNDSQKAELTNAVTRLSAATYASRFDNYSGEKFEVLGEEATQRGDLLVRTNIIDSKGQPVSVNYLMHEQDDEWRIVDVYLKGSISELATRRSEFTSVMKRQGFEGLIAAIDKRVAALKG